MATRFSPTSTTETRPLSGVTATPPGVSPHRDGSLHTQAQVIHHGDRSAAFVVHVDAVRARVHGLRARGADACRSRFALSTGQVRCPVSDAVTPLLARSFTCPTGRLHDPAAGPMLLRR